MFYHFAAAEHIYKFDRKGLLAFDICLVNPESNVGYKYILKYHPNDYRISEARRGLDAIDNTNGQLSVCT